MKCAMRVSRMYKMNGEGELPLDEEWRRDLKKRKDVARSSVFLATRDETSETRRREKVVMKTERE